MKETSLNSEYKDRIRSWADTHGDIPRSTRRDPNLLPISNPRTIDSTQSTGTGPGIGIDHADLHSPPSPPVNDIPSPGHGSHRGALPASKEAKAGDNSADDHVVSPPAASPPPTGPGSLLDGGDEKKPKKNIGVRFMKAFKTILLHTKLNILLVFVPVGIVVAEIPGSPPGLIFAMNALAIIPLAGLLSIATETVARKLGDSLGALLNVTFGNAVELIIFMYVYHLGKVIKTRKSEKPCKGIIRSIASHIS
ncbi:hypothetical protein B0H67DRAFT_88622 [Lasiosphaeris hirsuta]|uniref:Uncharacterized protein n=1 Tax=Lasiosphaeris hirsuta TaxID=260670 RepID=A0AA40BCN2_9PEZI|nr:hypothetical protein B0H67DRAFT_88622 [Lasiosphaeris hirsuta]